MTDTRNIQAIIKAIKKTIPTDLKGCAQDV